MSIDIHGTTVVCVRKDGHCAMAADGQVTQGQNSVLKATARKLRRIYNDKVVIGFAGSTADAVTLYELFEKKLEAVGGDLTRAAIDFAKQWRTDKTLSKLDAMMMATDGKDMFYLSGVGDVIAPDGDVMAIGSGGLYALSAAEAYLDSGVDLDALEIARRSIKIASTICIYTNDNITSEVI